MFGRVPFIDHTLIDVYNKIKNDPYLVPLSSQQLPKPLTPSCHIRVVFPSEIDADCADLIQQMLIKEPSERITLSDVKVIYALSLHAPSIMYSCIFLLAETPLANKKFRTTATARRLSLVVHTWEYLFN